MHPINVTAFGGMLEHKSSGMTFIVQMHSGSGANHPDALFDSLDQA
jgi:hypothetical protein